MSDHASALPRTWRPLGVRLAAVFFGLLLVIICAAAWFGFDAETRSRFTALQKGTLVGFGLLTTVLFHALGRARLTADDSGLTVVNGYRTRHYEWAQVVRIALPSGAPWARIDLADGTEKPVMAIQGSDGKRARDAVRQVRALIDR